MVFVRIWENCRDWPPGQSYREAAQKRTVEYAGLYPVADRSRCPVIARPLGAVAIPSPGEKVAERSEVGSGMRAEMLDAVYVSSLLKFRL